MLYDRTNDHRNGFRLASRYKYPEDIVVTVDGAGEMWRNVADEEGMVQLSLELGLEDA